MEKYLIVANWKMNPKAAKEALALFEAVKEGTKSAKNVEAVICPPFVWLPKLKAGGRVKLGAQNCHWEMQGAYTGEVSALMLADLGAKYVIVGHSERRQYLGENDELIGFKIKAVLKAELKPILCVGEKEGEEINLVIEEQLTRDLSGLSVNQMKQIVIAYEPIWAISTSDGLGACSPDSALSAALFIRRILTKLYSRFLADKIPILYGGSVNAQNAADYVFKAQVDGFLVGGASLEAEEFIKIVKNIGET